MKLANEVRASGLKLHATAVIGESVVVAESRGRSGQGTEDTRGYWKSAMSSGFAFEAQKKGFPKCLHYTCLLRPLRGFIG